MELPHYSDEELVKIIREKDQELYSEIIKRYQTKLSHYLRKFVRDRDELEDILQLVFIKVFKNLNSFDLGKKFSSWIYRIAHNESINYLKKNQNKISLDENELEIVDHKIDIILEVDRGLLKNKFEKIFNRLKPKYSEPLILFYFEEKSYEEISDILRIPISTVGTLILRGKKQLHDLLTS